MKLNSIAMLLATTAWSSAAITVQSYSYTPGAHPWYPDASGAELTDGIDSVTVWGSGFPVSDTAPLVGWQDWVAAVTFTFASEATVGKVTVWAADSDGQAGVGLPATITLSDPNSSFSQTFAITNPAGSGQTLALELGGFSVTTNQLTVSFVKNYEWTMLSEVVFDTVPEPTIPVITAPAALPLLLRRRRGTS